MGHGADQSKMKPPVGYKDTGSLYNVEPSVTSASREQSEICRLCLQNKRIKIDDQLAETLKEFPDFKEKVKEANLSCCATKIYENGNRWWVCETFASLMDAYKANVQSQGLTIDPCRCCPSHWDNDPLGHNKKPCQGKCEIKPLENKVGKW